MLQLHRLRSITYMKRLIATTLLTFLTTQLSLGQNNNPGFKNLLDSVVRLDIWEASFREGVKRTVRSQGSGVIMTKEGHILTNAHVATIYTEKIRVTLANKEIVDASFIGWDHWTDLAVLKLDTESMAKKGITFSQAKFGDSNSLELGQDVYAAGTPYGLTRTITKGVISNNNRYMETDLSIRGYESGTFNTWLQTDAAIHSGNSGGPLVKENGEVIGINSRGVSTSSALGFAVPSAIAKEVMHELIENHSVTRSHIGLVPRPLQDLESFFNVDINSGLLVQSIDPGSPAKRAGIKPSDIILSIENISVDGRFPEQIPPIMNQIASYPVGKEILLQVKRGETVLPIKVTTEKLESRIGEESAFEKWGLSLQKLTKPVAREKKLTSEDGFIVIGIQDAFPAQLCGLYRGDIIRKIDKEPLKTLEELRNIYENHKQSDKPLLLEVMRNHQVVYLLLKNEEEKTHED